ncbi:MULTISPECIES: co-chaperone DjlA [Pseudoalteromonas]|uniref:co-chaperone DjlA n=2 Tax=Pseudoalteromonas TaxID=53246 RepID=UPI00029A6B30|nr:MULTISPECIES: co-chaperone DjlA [Pseudoalteromonas]AUJ71073.1 DnaJ-like protein DjlA [Pseudoalteromonas sp. NC201]MCF2828170.1 co-chaperone DjlA [Pseudoalteromonas sp. OF5H-5]MCF2924258.1 co-chaperone DjlA [Pseudoalteromonas sp. DL2-H1]MCF7512160.1 co-chaperone DjlA [Pseudoalteromonas sp. L7]MCF7524626.1 co-chaperone DjlA [Pseudoalteromonas sp. L23]
MWGKLLGTIFGFLFGRWLGAILGFYLGHLFDKSLRQDFDKVGGFQGFMKGEDLHERQALFFSSCFSVMGHIAKSNGRVSEIHIQAASAFMSEMGLQGEERKEAQHAFTAGKSSDFSIKEAVTDFKEAFARRYDLRQLFLEIQIQMAFCDGHVSDAEKALLKQVSKYLGFAETHFLFLLKRYQAEFEFRRSQASGRSQHQYQQHGGRQPASQDNGLSRAKALAVLGLSEEANERDIKKAYRKLMSQHHPDKLVSQGLPKHMMEVAKRKSQDIQSAYEYLKKS